MNHAALLEQLKIDRGAEPRARTGALRIWLTAAAAAAAAAVGGAWLLTPHAGAPVDAAAAAAPSPAPAAAAAQPSEARGSILDASGYVVARRQATVSAKITGKVAAVLIEEGQRVDSGDVIARLDDANARAQAEQARAKLAQQRASLVAAEIAFANAVPTFARQQRQYELAVISAEAFDTAKTSYDAVRAALDVAARGVAVADAEVAIAQRALDDTVVRAPFAGVVTVKAAQEGEMVSPISAGGGFTRTGIGTIVDMESLEIEVDVSESFIHRVHPRQRAAISLNAYPSETLGGSVIAIVPTADRAKGTVKVRVAFDASDPRMLPEMGVRVAFLGSEQQ